MEADFSGYVTKAGLKCSDGRTIMPDAFKHQDTMQVPLVWQHGHSDPENVLGHVKLENRSDGVYGYGFFNKSPKADHARSLVEHGDINALSIWANDLVERAGRVLHGAIREVSLVLSGANPGALIENVTIRHSDGDTNILDDEAIIYTGLSLEHASDDDDDEDDDDDDEELTIQDVYDSMNEEQKQVLHYMVGEALESTASGSAKQSAISHQSDSNDDEDDEDGPTVQDIYDSMTEEQQQVLHYMVGEALESAKSESKQSSTDDDETDDKIIKQDNLGIDESITQKGNEMKHNVFENQGEKKDVQVISHSDIQGIVADATKNGSLKDAVENYALSHGIEDIDLLFPEAKALTSTPEFYSRRVEWVNKVLGAARKSPFSRIKTMSADLTVEQARAKGYIKGNLKKEEFFGVSRRTTTPTTIYKKQKLDRDDIIDITDFDVVAWLKSEMRLMLDEEIARAVLVGDGRSFDDDDKIDESCIRPIAKDHELFTTTVNVNIDDANSSVQEIIDAIVSHRHHYRGTGLPTLFTTETYISQFLLLKDTLGRRIYKSLDEVAAELRVSEIVPVEVLEEYSDIVCILANLSDYVIGADNGGNVSMFDDFDIDYNQHKYLIETRISGALVKLKSAIVVKKVDGTLILATPVAPTFEDGEITINDTTGVVYINADTEAPMTEGNSPYEVAAGTSVTVEATPASGYYFASGTTQSWTFNSPE